MKQKLLLYLSIAILLLPGILAMGATFAIVQGSLNSNSSIYFQVYADEVYLFDSFEISSVNGVYALSVTIPSQYSQVTIIPVVNDNILFSSDQLINSGDTLRLDVFLDSSLQDSPITVSSSKTSSFKFQPEENKQKIKDISNGNLKPYKDDINIMPIPIVKNEEPAQFIENTNVVSVKETPSFQQKSSFIENLNDFVLEPVVLLSLALIACLLLVLVVLKKRRSTYL